MDSFNTVGSIAAMPFWLALAFAVVVTVGSSVYVTLKGLEAFRAFKALSRNVGIELEHVSATSAQIERHLELAADSGSRLEESLARLRASRSQLNILTSALSDVRASVDRVTAVVPRK
jgi:tRNA threonylcarbamoyladenosine modification (KEOPS) complex Cgi121 subunit